MKLGTCSNIMFETTHLAMPLCRHCGRLWFPNEGVVAASSYCMSCAPARREIATNAFDLRPLAVSDAVDGYFLPRSLR